MKLMNGCVSLALALVYGACYVEPPPRVAVAAAPVAVEVDEAPPPQQYEAVVVRPGFVWIGGHWYRRGRRWEWRAGYYEPERVGYVWAPGRWEIRGHHHVWIEGGWRRR